MHVPAKDGSYGVSKKIDIWIGEFYASKELAVITTLLGSCVGVCLFDPILQVGGMNHILLPGRADLRNFNAPARYAVNAMELLINRIMALGGNRFRLIAKVFGGAQIMPAISVKNSPGKQNEEFVIQFLKNEGIKIVSSGLGGRHARKIIFYTHTGDVYVKRIQAASLKNIAVCRDKELEKTREKMQVAEEVTLFED
jgi:chemotaxis protein CheD